MKFIVKGIDYEAIRASDVDRDGMALEISQSGSEVLEIFYADNSGEMTLTAYRRNVPLELVEWAIASAKASLIPSHDD